MTLLPAFLLLIAPGLLWQVVGRVSRSDAAVWWYDAIALGVALNALFGLFTFYVRITLPSALVIGAYGGLGLLVGIAWLRWRAFRIPNLGWFVLILLTLGAIFALRMVQIRTLAAPAWVDSVHHTWLIRVIQDGFGVPAQISVPGHIPANLYYHVGYHVNGALAAMFSGLSLETLVLWFGQGLNALVALGVYRLAVAVLDDRKAGWVAMVLVGVVFQMPAYYVTWGRYTLLTGVLLLCAAMSVTLEIRWNAPSREAVMRLAVLTAAILFTHYLAALMLAMFLVVVWLGDVGWGRSSLSALARTRSPWILLLQGAGVGALIAFPWVWRVFSFASYARVEMVGVSASLDDLFFSNYLDYLRFLLGPQRSHVILVVGLVSLVLLGWRRRSRAFAVWSVLFVLVSLPWGINFRPFRPDHGAILMFLPGSVFAGALFAQVWGQKTWWARGVAVLALVGLVGWGVQETRDVLNPVTVFTTQADIAAMDWIRSSTDEDAVFLINTTPWLNSTYRGVDGGYWILPLTGRRTLLPPAMFVYSARDDVLQINDWAVRARTLTTCDEAFWALIREAEVTHIYLGSTPGSLLPSGLRECDGLSLAYQLDGVWIFVVVSE